MIDEKKLAAALEALANDQATMAGKVDCLIEVMTAIVMTHPDPDAFRRAYVGIGAASRPATCEPWAAGHAAVDRAIDLALSYPLEKKT